MKKLILFAIIVSSLFCEGGILFASELFAFRNWREPILVQIQRPKVAPRTKCFPGFRPVSRDNACGDLAAAETWTCELDEKINPCRGSFASIVVDSSIAAFACEGIKEADVASFDCGRGFHKVTHPDWHDRVLCVADPSTNDSERQACGRSGAVVLSDHVGAEYCCTDFAD